MDASALSLHFLALCAFLMFFIGHVTIVALHGFRTELARIPKQTRITKHCCIQGWSGVAEWTGVSLHHIVRLCHPLPSARYIVFYALDNKSTSEPHARGPGYFYGTIRMELANDPQTQLGFTMVKYIRVIEFVENYKTIGQGQGSWREDFQYFSQEAGI